MLKMIESLLDDGVLIFEEDLSEIDTLLKNYPDLITDIIKVHKFANENRDVVLVEHIYPTNEGLVYELSTFGVEEAIHLSVAVDRLGIRSQNLIVGVAYPKEVIDEGD
jgi:hypothetical protein